VRRSLKRAAREVEDLVVFGARDLGYIIRWPLVGHLTKADPARYAHPAHRREPDVVLLPGVYETWQFLRPIADVLFARGHVVHAVTAMGHNSGTVEDMATRVAAYLEEKDLHDVVFVAHSKGGLIGKYVMGHTRAARRVREMVTVNSPFSGSFFGHVIPMRAVRHFHPRHPTLSLLNESVQVNRRITSIVSRYDPLVRTHEAMGDASTVDLDAVGHFTVMNDPRVHRAIIAVVEREVGPEAVPAGGNASGRPTQAG
jgi:predicted alpha/beta hydrolase family esterase